jgi:hypothetical protein
MSDAKITVDLTGAIRKTQALKAIPSAFKYQVTSWMADTLLELKRSAAAMQASGPGRKTGQMARNIGHEIKGTDAAFEVIVGTGVGGKQSVKYAGIQDRGGTIKALDKFFTIVNLPGHPRIGPFLTIPLGNTKGRVKDYKNTFNIRSKSGNFLVMQSSRATGSMTTKKVYDPLTGRRTRGAPKASMKPLFVLKPSVTLPATHWFSGPMAQRLAYLAAMTTPEAVFEVAQRRAAGLKIGNID